MQDNTIIAIAGGKGGVGKSIFTANLAIALAEIGHSTVAVDLDLGGSNLHSFLGIPNDYPGIGDYLISRYASLEELLVPTSIENLKFIPGDGRTTGMANITFGHKMKLIQNLKKISARYILLDLSSGSSANTLDLFGIEEKGIILMTPDLPAIMNMLTFLKNFIFRSLMRTFNKNIEVVKLLKEVQKTPMADEPVSVKEVQNRIRAIDPVLGEKATGIFKKLHPRIVLNQGDHPDQLNLIQHIHKSTALMDIQVDFFGFIFYDPMVRKSIYQRKPLIPFYRDCVASSGIRDIADRLNRRWHQEIPDSDKLLKEYTAKFYKEAVVKAN